MKSKLLIDFDFEMNPVVRVLETYSDDTRDRLVSKLRHNLWSPDRGGITSKTFTVNTYQTEQDVVKTYPGTQVWYDLLPVKDEISYFKHRFQTIVTERGIEPDKELKMLQDKYFKKLEELFQKQNDEILNMLTK